MQVFITGATGYVGSSVSESFRRAGHTVWGLIVKEEEAPLLERNEIHPVMGDLQQPESYRHVAEQCDALIHCAADYRHNWAASDRQTIEAMMAISRSGTHPKAVVFTSGSWVYGDTDGKPMNESAPVATRILAGGHRPAIEQMLIHATDVRGLVVRPADVYGKRESFLSRYFAAAYQNETLVIPGDGHNHLPLVHVDDLGMGYLRAVESGLRGEIFNIADPSHLTLLQVVTAIARSAGYRGEVRSEPVSQAAQTIGADAEIYAMDASEDASKARRLLGWEPRHTSFADEVDTYFEAWKAWHPQETQPQQPQPVGSLAA